MWTSQPNSYDTFNNSCKGKNLVHCYMVMIKATVLFLKLGPKCIRKISSTPLLFGTSNHCTFKVTLISFLSHSDAGSVLRQYVLLKVYNAALKSKCRISVSDLFQVDHRT
ncbi:hypothetical protein XENOCAPTIV_002746 [Xenoophorus captivus]|uniref:Uncharacterized protein n=1 Tax=Xenoophorus captivus TaxID=1517983 RepID=A0ABV0S4S4_9TELE